MLLGVVNNLRTAVVPLRAFCHVLFTCRNNKTAHWYRGMGDACAFVHNCRELKNGSGRTEMQKNIMCSRSPCRETALPLDRRRLDTDCTQAGRAMTSCPRGSPRATSHAWAASVGALQCELGTRDGEAIAAGVLQRRCRLVPLSRGVVYVRPGAARFRAVGAGAGAGAGPRLAWYSQCTHPIHPSCT